MAGENTAIFRVTSTGDNEGNVANNEKLLWNPTDINENNKFVFSTEIFYRNSIPENAKVQGQINEVQDMGLDGIDVQLVCRVQNSSNATTDSNMDILKKWLIEDKTIGDFPKGRFGLRLDDIPIFNLTPVGSGSGQQAGYVLANIRFTRPQDHKNKVDCIITLRYSGDPVRLGN